MAKSPSFQCISVTGFPDYINFYVQFYRHCILYIAFYVDEVFVFCLVIYTLEHMYTTERA